MNVRQADTRIDRPDLSLQRSLTCLFSVVFSGKDDQIPKS